jgi:hypothetical protein
MNLSIADAQNAGACLQAIAFGIGMACKQASPFSPSFHGCA